MAGTEGGGGGRSGREAAAARKVAVLSLARDSGVRSPRTLSEETGASVDAVRRWLRQAGIGTRRRKPQRQAKEVVECRAQGCSRPAAVKGLCPGHRIREKKGHPVDGALATRTPPGTRCSVPGCPNPAKSRGLCGGHYERKRRTGDPGGVLPPRPDTRQRAEIERLARELGSPARVAERTGWPATLVRAVFRAKGITVVRARPAQRQCAVEGCTRGTRGGTLCHRHRGQAERRAAKARAGGWTPRQLAIMERLRPYVGGWKGVLVIAAETGLGKGVVRRWMGRMGHRVRSKSEHNARRRQELAPRVAELAKEGRSVAEIAKAAGISVTTVHRWLQVRSGALKVGDLKGSTWGGRTQEERRAEGEARRRALAPEVVRLRRQGLGVQAIARTLRTGGEWVGGVVREAAAADPALAPVRAWYRGEERGFMGQVEGLAWLLGRLEAGAPGVLARYAGEGEGIGRAWIRVDAATGPAGSRPIPGTGLRLVAPGARERKEAMARQVGTMAGVAWGEAMGFAVLAGRWRRKGARGP